MRLTDWVPLAPSPESLAPRVERALLPVLATLTGRPDPHVLPVWADDPSRRWTLLALAPDGLAVIALRLDVPGDAPRLAGRLVRWSRLQMGELALETSGEHRILTITVEGQVLRVADEAAERVAWFVRALHALEDGRELPAEDVGAIAMPAPAPRATSPAAAARPADAPVDPANRLPIRHPDPGVAR